jgi:hypothetical protein
MLCLGPVKQIGYLREVFMAWFSYEWAHCMGQTVRVPELFGLKFASVAVYPCCIVLQVRPGCTRHREMNWAVTMVPASAPNTGSR